MAKSRSLNNLNIFGRRVNLAVVTGCGRHWSASRTLYQSGELTAFNLWLGRIMFILLIHAR